MKNPFNINDIVEVSSRCPYDNLVGSKGTVIQIIPSSKSCIVSFGDYYIVDDSPDDLNITSDFCLSYDWIILYQDSEDSYVEELEDQVKKLEDELVMLRVCMEVSEQIRESQYKEILELSNEIIKLKSIK